MKIPNDLLSVQVLLVAVLVLGVGLFALGVYIVWPTPTPVITSQTNTVSDTPTTPISPQPTGKTLNVSMGSEWTATGLTVNSGQMISLQASGTGVWKNISRSNPNATPNAYEECGPEGTSPNSSDYSSNLHLYQTRDANKGALIGRIGSGIPFKVGKSLNIRAERSGELYLGINDMRLEVDRTSYNDNTGGFQVKVTIK